MTNSLPPTARPACPEIIGIRSANGFPFIEWTDDLNRPRTYKTLYYRGPNNTFFYCPGRHYVIQEHRPAIVQLLQSLPWAEGRDCPTSAPWLCR